MDIGDGEVRRRMHDVRHIRLAMVAEAPVLAGIYASTVRELGPQLYTPEQVEAWSGFGAQVEKFRALLETAETFVWEEGGAVLGFCTIESTGYVNLLYVAAGATRKGIGGHLLAHALRHAETVHGVRRFTTKASHFSRALFARHGFVVEEEEHVDYGGVTFHRFSMARELP
jgi:putative acetyltransferase